MNGSITRVIIVATSIGVTSAVIASSSPNTRVLSHVEQSYVSSWPTKISRIFTEGDSVEVYSVRNAQGLIEMADMAYQNYSTWLIRSFGLALTGMAIGLAALVYISLLGVSLTAVIGTYLIPLSLGAIYYLLGVAERTSNS